MSSFLIERSISVGIFILVTVCLRALLINKLPKKVFLILWGIALLRLGVPYSFLSKWNLITIFNNISSRVSQDPTGETNAIERIFLNIEESYRPLTRDITFVQSRIATDTITVIWLVGAISIGIFFAITFYKNNKNLRTALPVRNHPFIENWLSQQKLVRQIQVKTSDRLVSPIACGLINPRIILPKSLDLSDKELLRHILTHEKMHIKYLDILWKLLSAFILCCYWFNPLVWLMHILIIRDLELTCDERVLETLGEQEKSSYALSLIHMAERNAKLTSFYYGFSNNSTKERIVSIMKFKKTTALTFCISAILIAGTATVFATNGNPADVSLITGESGGIRNKMEESIDSIDEIKSKMTDNGVYIKDISEPDDNYGLESYSYKEYKAEMENIEKVGDELVKKGKMSQNKLSQVLSSMQDTLNEIKKGEIVVYKPIKSEPSNDGDFRDTSGLYLSGTKW